MINDDKPLVRVGPEGAVIFGTPWNGKHRLGENISAPLKGICFLQRGERNAIAPVSAAEAYPLLLRQVYRPRDAAALDQTLRLLDALCRAVDFYRLSCNMDLDAARVSSQAMTGRKNA